MRKPFYLILIAFLLCLTGCPGVNGVNTQEESGEYRQGRPSVLYEGTGITDPNSEL
jgi:hypothetical protein